tara:strand:- start:1051 stop:1425 length:375 start_codon:yes stop_codon:yes gene_type:complete
MKPVFCREAKYHNMMFLAEYPDAQVEVCTRCGEKYVFNKDKKTGRIDNSYYYDVHARDYLQPFGDTMGDYIKEYGVEAYENSIKQRDDHADKMITRSTRKERKGYLKEKKKWLLNDKLSNGFYT